MRANVDPERQRINNKVFYTYYQQLSLLIASKPRITKELTYLYKKKIKFMADMNRIYIKLQGIKDQDWFTGSYQMEQQDIEKSSKSGQKSGETLLKT